LTIVPSISTFTITRRLFETPLDPPLRYFALYAQPWQVYVPVETTLWALATIVFTNNAPAAMPASAARVAA